MLCFSYLFQKASGTMSSFLCFWPSRIFVCSHKVANLYETWQLTNWHRNTKAEQTCWISKAFNILEAPILVSQWFRCIVFICSTTDVTCALRCSGCTLFLLSITESTGAPGWFAHRSQGLEAGDLAESNWLCRLCRWYIFLILKKTKLCHFAPPPPLKGGEGQNGRAS